MTGKANRQTCVDVLCAYLRMPYEPDPGKDSSARNSLPSESSREVRHTVIRVIAAHLQEGAAVSWQGLNFDFTGVVFDGGNFVAARFSGGTVDFDAAEFSSGTVNFNDAKFSGDWVIFDGAKFSGGTVNFEQRRVLRRQSASSTPSSPAAKSTSCDAEFSGGTVTFDDAKFSGGTVELRPRRVSPAAKSASSTPSSPAARSTSSTPSSPAAKVDFSDLGDWSYPPIFSWTGTPPSGVKLPPSGAA